jgi:hypothetical protein
METTGRHRSAADRGDRQTSSPSDDMKLTVAAIILLVSIFSSGCTTTVTSETLMRRATRHSLTLWPDTTYYCGSRRAFDYFYIQPAGPTTFRRAHLLRVRKSENVVSDRFDYTTERGQWRVFVGLNRKEREPVPGQQAGTTTAPAEQIRR